MYYTVREAAQALGNVSASTVYGMCAAGVLEHIRVGLGRGTIRIPVAAVERLREQRRVAPTDAARPPLRHLSA